MIGFSVFLLGLIRRLPHVNLDNLVRRLAIFAGVMAIFAVVQKALSGSDGTELVYGFWRPNAPGNIYGPFINRNHFAGWMLMAASVAFGFAFGLLARSGPKGRGWAAWSRWLGSPEGSQFALTMLAVLAMGASIVHLRVAIWNGQLRRGGRRLRGVRVARVRPPCPVIWWLRAGAVASLAGIAAQSLIEFSLQMPGNTTLFLVVVAIAVHRPLRSARALAQQQRAA